MRKMGDIMLDLEVLLTEMVDEHDLQVYEVLYLTYGWLKVHRPDAIEEYIGGGNPEFYAPKDVIKKWKKKSKKGGHYGYQE